MLEHLKILTNGHQHRRTTKDEEVYVLDKCSSQIEKQSNKDRNIPTHLENSGANIKTVLVFWLLIMTSAYVLITNCGLSGCVYICE